MLTSFVRGICGEKNSATCITQYCSYLDTQTLSASTADTASVATQLCGTTKPGAASIMGSTVNVTAITDQYLLWSSRLFGDMWHAGFTTPSQGHEVCLNFGDYEPDGFKQAVDRAGLYGWAVENNACGWDGNVGIVPASESTAAQQLRSGLSHSLAYMFLLSSKDQGFKAYFCSNGDRDGLTSLGLDAELVLGDICK